MTHAETSNATAFVPYDYTDRQTAYGASPRLKVLVVEDDLDQQDIWESIIKKLDPRAKILWATTEEGAEKIIRNHLATDEAFDFVICDIFLAGKRNGVDLWHRYGGDQSLFFFATGASERKLRELLGSNWEEYPFLMRKPLNPEVCLTSIKEMLDCRQAFRDQMT